MNDAAGGHCRTTLREIGEFALLEEVVLPIARRDSSIVSPIGDDCAFVRLPSGDHELVVTADVGPRPLVWCLGHESYRTWGWYSVMVNASDLASAGAIPLVLTSSIDAPSEMLVDDLREFFEGVSEASRAYNLSNAGGNIRQASKFACHVTAMGYVTKGNHIRRVGARPGDLLVSIGAGGRFASAFLRARQSGFPAMSPEDRDCLCRPVAYLKEMSLLHGLQLIGSASDASDGVLGGVWNLAEASSCGMQLDMLPENLPREISDAAREFGYDPWNLMYFWGDWQIIASVHADREAEFSRTVKAHQIPSYVLGRVTQGPPRLIGMTERGERTLRLLRNENFVKLSFNDDPLSNVEYMLRTPLLQ